MTVKNNHQYTKVIWAYRSTKEDKILSLTKKDVDHLYKIYKKYNIQPESMDCVSVEFMLQREKLTRFIIKELDVMLKIDGIFEIIIMDSKSHSSYTRSRDQVKYEMSISTNGRYQLIKTETVLDNKVLKLTYLKTASVLPNEDAMDRWSFGIVTNGKNNERVKRLISTIAKQHIPEYEIIVCGPYAHQKNDSHVKLLEDVVLVRDVRAPLCAKKNKIIRAAQYNNVCILHERFYLPDHWFAQCKQYGNYFDFLCLPTIDASGRRFNVDWMRFCEPITRTCTKNKAVPYSQWSTDQIIQGGVILGKKHLISQFMLDERLFWEELEDIHFSKMAYLNGAFITTDVNNYFISDAVNHRPEKKKNVYQIFREKLSWVMGVGKNFLKFQFCIKKFYKEFGAELFLMLLRAPSPAGEGGQRPDGENQK